MGAVCPLVRLGAVLLALATGTACMWRTGFEPGDAEGVSGADPQSGDVDEDAPGGDLGTIGDAAGGDAAGGDAAGGDAASGDALSGDVDDSSSAVAIVIVVAPPASAVVGSAIAVQLEARNAAAAIDPLFVGQVTLVTSGGATGGGLVTLSGGVATVNLADTTAESVSLSLVDSQSTGLDVASTATIEFLAGAPEALSLTGPTQLAVSECGGPYVITLRDSFGNAALSPGLDVALSGAGSGGFFVAANCSGATSSVNLPAGVTNGAFYFLDPTSETLDLSVSSGSLATDTLPVSVNDPLTGGLLAWFRADDLNGNGDGNLGWTNGAPVSTWPDVAAGRDALAPAGFEPTLQDGVIGGRPVLRFVNSHYLESVGVVAALNGLSDSGGGFSLVYVKSIAQTGKMIWIGLFGPGPADDHVQFGIFHQGASDYLAIGFASSENLLNPVYATTPVVHTLTMDNASFTVRLFEGGAATPALESTSVVALPVYSQVGRFVIGMDWDDGGGGTWLPSDFFEGDLAELLVYDHALSPGERLAAEAYLASKYGL